MEYLNGLSLAELVERHGALPPGRVVYLLRQVCGALGEAHAAGLIHRDIKPSNIFAARRGGLGDVAKLLDFGLVLSRAGSDAAHLSGEGQVLGTPLYMSPEQATAAGSWTGGATSTRWGRWPTYLLTGRPPFDGEGGIGVMIAHARDPVVPPVAGPRRCPRGPGARRAAVPGQGPGRAVPGCRGPGAGPGRVRLRGGLGPGPGRAVVARRRRGLRPDGQPARDPGEPSPSMGPAIRVSRLKSGGLFVGIPPCPREHGR